MVRLIVNGNSYELYKGTGAGLVSDSDSLAYTLRETLGLTGTKHSCGQGACGACTVIMEGKAVLSCLILTVECDGREITTIEGSQNWRTGSVTAGIYRPQSFPVRVLHPRHDPDVKSPARQ